jgi:hypothetical protein
MSENCSTVHRPPLPTSHRKVALPRNELTALQALESAHGAPGFAWPRLARVGGSAPAGQDVACECLIRMGPTPEAAQRVPVYDLSPVYLAIGLPFRLTLGAAAVVHQAHGQARSAATAEQILGAARHAALRASELMSNPTIAAPPESARPAESMQRGA